MLITFKILSDGKEIPALISLDEAMFNINSQLILHKDTIISKKSTIIVNIDFPLDKLHSFNLSLYDKDDENNKNLSFTLFNLIESTVHLFTYIYECPKDKYNPTVDLKKIYMYSIEYDEETNVYVPNIKQM